MYHAQGAQGGLKRSQNSGEARARSPIACLTRLQFSLVKRMCELGNPHPAAQSIRSAGLLGREAHRELHAARKLRFREARDSQGKGAAKVSSFIHFYSCLVSFHVSSCQDVFLPLQKGHPRSKWKGFPQLMLTCTAQAGATGRGLSAPETLSVGL